MATKKQKIRKILNRLDKPKKKISPKPRKEVIKVVEKIVEKPVIVKQKKGKSSLPLFVSLTKKVKDLTRSDKKLEKEIAGVSKKVEGIKIPEMPEYPEMPDTDKLREELLDEIRKEKLDVLSRIPRGGGNANRAIFNAGAKLSSKYTDIDLIEGTGINYTTADDDVNKNVELTLSVDAEELDHSALLNLLWTDSGHTGTASRLAAFNGAGAATYIDYSTDWLSQYVFKDGRSGGQIVNLGLDESDGGEIHSTANATKGTINIGDAAYVDEANMRLWVGELPVSLGGNAASLNVTNDATNLINATFIKNSNDIGAAQNYFLKSRGTLASPTIVQLNDRIGVLKGPGYDGNDYEDAVQIRLEVDDTPSSNVMPTRITWHTENSSGSRGERMRLDKDGNLGVGSPTPLARVHITASSGDVLRVIGTGSNNTLMRFQDDLTERAALFILNGATEFNIRSQGEIALVTGGSVDALVADANGDVGLKTNSPRASLDVNDTDAIIPAAGTVAQRPGSPVAGMTRYNSDNNIIEYYDGTDWISLNGNSEKSWGFDSPSGTSGTFYFGGFYDFGATDNDFNPSINFGTANSSYAAHFFVVAASGATNTQITVTGTSITDAGVRTTSDTEVLSLTDGSANVYYETAKKWIGQVSVNKTAGTDRLCNYGWCKYWDNNNSDFNVVGLEATWLGGANDSSADIRLRHHKTTGWTYNAGSTPTPPAAITSMVGDHSTESEIKNNENGAWKRDNLSTSVSGGDSEGTIVEIVTSSNRAFELGTFMLRIKSK